MSEPREPAREAPRFFPIAASFYLALAVTGVVGLGLTRGRLGLELLVDPGSWWTDLGLGLGAGAVLLGLWELLRRVARGPRRVERELTGLIGELSAGEAAAIAVVSAIGEEIAFRGAFQSWIGWIPSAILFGALHLGPGRHFRWWAAWALAGGLGLGLMVDQRGSLGAAILAHLLVNAVQLQRLRTRAPERDELEDLEPPEDEPSAGEIDTDAATADDEGEPREREQEDAGEGGIVALEPAAVEDERQSEADAAREESDEDENDRTQQVAVVVDEAPSEPPPGVGGVTEAEPVDDDRPTDEIDPSPAREED